MKILSLNGAWHIKGISTQGETMEFDGVVPGCVHTDLYREKIIPDPLYRDNFKKCQWIEDYNWIYSKTFIFASEDAENIYIKFGCLDVECDIFLNSIKVGSADNMFIEHSFCVDRALKNGENEIQIVFYAHTKRTAAMPQLHGAFTKERLHKRRMQCTYGWDWVERFVTCGIEKEVCLIKKEKCELDDVYVFTKSADADTAQIVIDTHFEGICYDVYAEYTISDPNGITIFKKSLIIAEEYQYQDITIENPLRWYPCGYGESPLYLLVIRLIDKNGTMLSERRQRFGIRTVKIIEKIDAKGSDYWKKCIELKKSAHLKDEWDNWDENSEFCGFIVAVNDIPIMCKGGCWVPTNPFVPEQTEHKIKDVLNLLADANVNMIRVWGGGMFETDCFYEECDRLGIMVSQDMLMACGAYPDSENDFCEHLRKEAEYAAYKLRNHACLVFWSGDNENAIRGNDNMPDYDGRRVVRGVIAKVIKQLDYNRRFLPSSPYGGVPYGSVTCGTTHNSQFLGAMFSYIRTSDMKDYVQRLEEYLSRFVAEAPTFGACSPEMMKRFMTYDDIFGDNNEIEIAHTRNNPALTPLGLYDYMIRSAEKIMGEFENVQDKLRKLQYAQYECVRNSLELYRRNKWFSSGILFWQLNDCWPTYGSWSLIDFYNFPKAAYYAFKRSAKGVIVSMKREHGKFRVYLCNDTLADTSGKMTLRKVDKSSVIKEWTCDYACCANESTVVFEICEKNVNLNDDEVLICDVTGDRTILYNTTPAAFGHLGEYEVVDDKNGQLTVLSKGLTIDVELMGEYIFEDNYFILLPGEKRSIKYKKVAR